jgi:hypothetical protein
VAEGVAAGEEAVEEEAAEEEDVAEEDNQAMKELLVES